MTLCVLGLIACATAVEDDGSVDHAGSDLTTGRGGERVDLLYEGTCAFLHGCSSWSKKLPEGEVMWGCGGAGVCDDGELWVAGPSKRHCNKHVRLCNGERCTNALVKDISASQRWEASSAVLDKLGLDYELRGKCSGSGGGRVSAIFPAPADLR